MRKRLIDSVLLTLLTALLPAAAAAEPPPPRRLLLEGETKDAGAAGGARTAFAMMRLPDGSFAFYDRNRPGHPLRLPDEQGRIYTLLPPLPKEIVSSDAITDSGVLNNTQVVLARDGEVKSVSVRNEALSREEAARIGLPRYLNVWLQRAGPGNAFEPKMTWRGYNGSQMEYQELSNGRLLVPHGSFQPHARATPPRGRHKTIVQFSDDGGAAWQVSETKLVSPCYPGFNGSNEGACEPAIEELRDGRVWMLMRTQAGFLYQSISDDHGTTWSPARASRFHTSTGPPNIMRHANGWLVVCWNNCEMPPRHDGQGVYGGRDALHIAVSDDDGKRWRGFREIYLDHRRNDNPAKSGDRGTAYPLAGYTADGQIVVLAGQGEGGRNPILIDPDWIVAAEAMTDFSDGLRQWSVYKHYGPAKRWWRARATSGQLTAHPSDDSRRCLQVRKPDKLPGDGATWNFPNGWKGELHMRLMIREGFGGGMLCLNDRFFDPTNDAGEELSVFRVELKPDGSIGGVKLPVGQWVEATFQWDLSDGVCHVLVNDSPGQGAGAAVDAGTLKLRTPTLNGLSYLRLRSTAKERDPAGFLVDRVRVKVADPFAPPCGEQKIAKAEQRYVREVAARWPEQ